LNIRMLLPYYSLSNIDINNPIDVIKHMIITKAIKVNLSEPLNFTELIKQLEVKNAAQN